MDSASRSLPQPPSRPSPHAGLAGLRDSNIGTYSRLHDRAFVALSTLCTHDLLAVFVTRVPGVPFKARTPLPAAALPMDKYRCIFAQGTPDETATAMEWAALQVVHCHYPPVARRRRLYNATLDIVADGEPANVQVRAEAASSNGDSNMNLPIGFRPPPLNYAAAALPTLRYICHPPTRADPDETGTRESSSSSSRAGSDRDHDPGTGLSGLTPTRFGFVDARGQFMPRMRAANPPPPPYHTCACLTVWRRARFLPEWVRYHASIGVDAVMVYDNESDDHLAAAVGWLQAGYNVRYQAWPYPNSHPAVFSHCAMLSRGLCRWTLFTDIDEFVGPAKISMSNSPQSTSRHPEHQNTPSGGLGWRLDSFLDAPRMPPAPALMFRNWAFTPSGHGHRSPMAGILAGYVCRRRQPERVSGKTVAQPARLHRSFFNTVHRWVLADADEQVQVVRQDTDACLFHYKHQAWEIHYLRYLRRMGLTSKPFAVRKHFDPRSVSPDDPPEGYLAFGNTGCVGGTGPQQLKPQPGSRLVPDDGSAETLSLDLRMHDFLLCRESTHAASSCPRPRPRARPGRDLDHDESRYRYRWRVLVVGEPWAGPELKQRWEKLANALSRSSSIASSSSRATIDFGWRAILHPNLTATHGPRELEDAKLKSSAKAPRFQSSFLAPRGKSVGLGGDRDLELELEPPASFAVANALSEGVVEFSVGVGGGERGEGSAAEDKRAVADAQSTSTSTADRKLDPDPEDADMDDDGGLPPRLTIGATHRFRYDAVVQVVRHPLADLVAADFDQGGARAARRRTWWADRLDVPQLLRHFPALAGWVKHLHDDAIDVDREESEAVDLRRCAGTAAGACTSSRWNPTAGEVRLFTWLTWHQWLARIADVRVQDEEPPEHALRALCQAAVPPRDAGSPLPTTSLNAEAVACQRRAEDSVSGSGSSDSQSSGASYIRWADLEQLEHIDQDLVAAVKKQALLFAYNRTDAALAGHAVRHALQLY